MALWIVAGCLLAVLIAWIGAAIWFRHRVEPMLRGKVIESLSTRFNSRVELGEFHVDILNGLAVQGSGLKLFPNIFDSDQPLFVVSKFSFHTTWTKLLRSPIRIEHVTVEGLEINLPPKDQRKRLPSASGGGKISIYVNEIEIGNAHLVLGTNKPGKVPLDFDIRHLVLHSVGNEQSMRFTATLVNPKPIGDIATTGNFGPYNSGDPGSSPVNGKYEFTNADLSTIKGIAGILSSKGQYSGQLDEITVDGTTETPDFRLTISGHPVALHTDFHAIVDGTNGDTYLQPVNATLLHSHIVARGSVVRSKDRNGHHILLDATVDNSRIEDLLKLGVRTDPPVMTGTVRLKTKIEIPPGNQPVSDKLRLKGNFEVTGAHFTTAATQKKIDSLSMRAQGKPKQASDNIPDNVNSRMKGNFTLLNSSLTLSVLEYTVPGLRVDMDGVYSLDGNKFDFHGKARTDAKLSQMTTGWKSLVLKPVDPFFAKDGAGTEVPIKVTGTKSEPKFGLDFGHKDGDKSDDKKK
jgi:hypothetical protein